LILGAAVFTGGLLCEAFVIPHGLGSVRYLVYGFSSGAIILAASTLERQGHLRAPNLLVWLGGASYAIYLVHYSVITLCAVILLKLGWIPINDIVLIAVSLLGLVAGAAFYGFVDQPIQTRLRRFGRLRFVPDRLQPSYSVQSTIATMPRTREERPW
jgi:peptidoglycan/LPS O-acetylase OafA/YrhL